MSVNLPTARNVFIAEVPLDMKTISDVTRYLGTLRTSLEREFAKGFDNSDALRNATNTSDSNIGAISAQILAINTDIATLGVTVSAIATDYASKALDNLENTVVNTDIYFNGYQAQGFVVENRTSDYTSTLEGLMWFRTDV